MELELGYTRAFGKANVRGTSGEGMVAGERGLFPVEELTVNGYSAFVNMPTAADGAWHRLPLVVRYGDDW